MVANRLMLKINSFFNSVKYFACLSLSICPDAYPAHLILVLHEAERLLPVRSVDHHGLSTDTCHAAAAAAAKSGVLPVVVMMMVMVAVAGAAEGHGSYVVPRLWLLPIGLEENE